MRIEDAITQRGLTEAESFAVYWRHAGELRPGPWMLSLMNTIVLASQEERERLRAVYPTLVEGIERAQAEPGWLELAEKKAREAGWIS